MQATSNLTRLLRVLERVESDYTSKRREPTELLNILQGIILKNPASFSMSSYLGRKAEELQRNLKSSARQRPDSVLPSAKRALIAPSEPGRDAKQIKLLDSAPAQLEDAKEKGMA